MNFKWSVCLILVAFIAQTLAVNEEIQRLLECGNQENIDISEIKSMAKHNFENANKEFKCFTKCLYEKMEIMKDDNLIEEGFIKNAKKVKPTVAKRVFKACKMDVDDEVGKKPDLTACEKAFVFFKCNAEFVPQMG